MKLSQSPAFVTTLSFTDAPDIHLLVMVGLVAIAGIAGMSTVGLLLLLAPLATLFMGRAKPRRVTASASPALRPVEGPDGGASQPPSSPNSRQTA